MMSKEKFLSLSEGEVVQQGVDAVIATLKEINPTAWANDAALIAGVLVALSRQCMRTEAATGRSMAGAFARITVGVADIAKEHAAKAAANN